MSQAFLADLRKPFPQRFYLTFLIAVTERNQFSRHSTQYACYRHPLFQITQCTKQPSVWDWLQVSESTSDLPGLICDRILPGRREISDAWYRTPERLCVFLFYLVTFRCSDSRAATREELSTRCGLVSSKHREPNFLLRPLEGVQPLAWRDKTAHWLRPSFCADPVSLEVTRIWPATT